MTEPLALQFLEVTLPISIVDLKAAYRRMAHEVHPDKGGSQEAFVKVKQAFDLLMPLAKDGLRTSAANRTTIEGTPLSELGRGFPITESARPCKECTGKGYTIFKDAAWGPCLNCEGIGLVRTRKVDCRKCRGTGVFEKDGVKKGPCYGCQGTGKFTIKLQRPETCRPCRGVGIAKTEKATDQFSTCFQCKGIGEEKMFNPVLPRGLLALGSKR